MALAPVFLFSFLLHAFIGWRVAPELSLVDAALGPALWLLLGVSATLTPMGMLARRIAPPPLANILTWMGLLCMGLFSSLLVLTVLREALLLLVAALQTLWPSVLASSSLRADSALALPVVALLVTVLGF